MDAAISQPERLRVLVARGGIVRARDLRKAGVAGATIQRAVRKGDLVRVGRGLYQDPQAEIDAHLTLAEAAKRVPRGVIAMTSALAFHGLTDQMPRATWIAIRKGGWTPVNGYPPVRAVRFANKYMTQGIEHHRISGVEVAVFSAAKTLADVFRNGRLVDRSVAVEGLRAAIEQRKATPGEIARAARNGGAWRQMRPYLEALTFDG